MILVVKKTAVIVVIILLAVVVCGSVLAVEGTRAAATKKSLPIYGVESEDSVAITFDAAWGSDKTLDILDILDRYEVKATFFLVGFWVDKYPDMVREIYSRGHLIGNHSNNHPHFNRLSREEMELEITTTEKKISAVTGQKVGYFRAPFGEYNDTLLSYLKDTDVKCIQWTVDTLDWKGISAKEITDRAMRAKAGDIILCHNNSDHIVDALPTVLLGLRNKGLRFVTLEELVRHDDYYLDNNGIQRPAV